MDDSKAPAPAHESASRRASLPAAVWFLLGAAAASAGWYGYGLMQLSMARSLAAASIQAAAAASESSEDPGLREFLKQAQATTAQLSAAASAMTASGSSLDLVSGPQASSRLSETPVQGQAAQVLPSAGAGMVGALAPLLNDPRALAQLSPEHRRRVVELTSMLGALEASMRTGRPLDPQTQAQVQRMVREMQNVQPRGQDERP